jgi:hypothetical protein
MKLQIVLTSLVVATLASPAFARNSSSIALPNGTIEITQIGEEIDVPYNLGRFKNVSSDCSAQTVAETRGVALSSLLKSEGGGVVFDDGVSGNIQTGSLELDTILNLGKQAWKIIQNNAPVVETRLASANALPQGIQCWNQLERWQAIRSVDYQVAFKTVVGLDAVKYVARLTYVYGGSHKGKGRFIANAMVKNKEINVNWSNQLNVDVEIPTVVNAGTSENPVAVMQVNININNKNRFIPIKELGTSKSFLLFGDGRPVKVIN